MSSHDAGKASQGHRLSRKATGCRALSWRREHVDHQFGGLGEISAAVFGGLVIAGSTPTDVLYLAEA
jgi:hypothetical protein